jgi:hypothetical protein
MTMISEAQKKYLESLEGSKFDMLYKEVFPFPAETKEEASTRIDILKSGHSWQNVPGIRESAERVAEREEIDLYWDGAYTETTWEYPSGVNGMVSRLAKELDEKYSYWASGAGRLHTVIDAEQIAQIKAERTARR